MALPTNIDSSYADAADPSVKLHQQYHDTIHAAVNALDGPTGKAPRHAPLELIKLFGYGHSFVQANAGPSDTAHGYLSRLGGRFRVTSTTNNGTSGNQMAKTLMDVVNGAATGSASGKLWAPGTKGLVILDSVINDIGQVVSADDAQNKVGFQNALKTILRILRCSSWVDETDASITYPTGTWGTSSLVTTRGGAVKSSTTSGAQISITTTASEVCLMFVGFNSPNVTATVTVNGAGAGTIDCGSTASATSLVNYQLFSTRLTGLSGTSTIVVTKDSSANALYFDGYLVMGNATPPNVVVVKDHIPTQADINAVWTADTNRTPANLAIYNGYVDTICALAEFSDVLVADGGVGWDDTLMAAASTPIHPNDIGHAHYADVIEDLVSSLPYRAGLN